MENQLHKLIKHIESFKSKPINGSLGEGISTVPYIGSAKDCMTAIAQLANDAKLQYAWYCIAKGVNIEKSINEIYNYVSNSERAFYISNEFRKIILSVSCISSSIISYIMGNVIEENRDCTHKEIIITNALTNMSDYDIDNFIDLFDNHSYRLAGREVIEITKINRNKESYYYTLQLCASNGLFKTESDLMGEDLDDPDDMAEEGCLYGGLYYVKTEYSYALRNYIDEVKQLLGRNRSSL